MLRIGSPIGDLNGENAFIRKGVVEGNLLVERCFLSFMRDSFTAMRISQVENWDSSRKLSKF